MEALAPANVGTRRLRLRQPLLEQIHLTGALAVLTSRVHSPKRREQEFAYVTDHLRGNSHRGSAIVRTTTVCGSGRGYCRGAGGQAGDGDVSHGIASA